MKPNLTRLKFAIERLNKQSNDLIAKGITVSTKLHENPDLYLDDLKITLELIRFVTWVADKKPYLSGELLSEWADLALKGDLSWTEIANKYQLK